MPKNINQNEAVTKEANAKLDNKTGIRASRIADAKNIFKHKDKEKAFKKRYGKDVLIVHSYELEPDNTIREYTVQFQSPKRNHYSITELMEDGATVYVLLSYKKDNRNHTFKYKRYIDAEVHLADELAKEE